MTDSFNWTSTFGSSQDPGIERRDRETLEREKEIQRLIEAEREEEEILTDNAERIRQKDLQENPPLEDLEFQGIETKPEHWLLRSLGWVGDRFDDVDRAAGIGEFNVYNARQKILKPLTETHVALGILGEFFVPDTIDIATLGLSYIPKRFAKIPKVWAKLTKAMNGDAARAILRGDDMLVDAATGMRINAGDFSGIDDLAKQSAQPLMSKGISKGEGYSYRKGRPLKNPIWDNLTPTVQKQFKDAGIDSDKAKFFIENWTREVGATVEGLPFTSRTFEFMQSKLLPEILEDLKGVDLSDGLQLDHIAQLKAMTPFYKGRNLTQAQKIRRILIKEGIFGGHNPKNLQYLPTDVHTVKTNFWRDQVGDAGEKFFEGRSMRTYADVEKAAKEMKEFIIRSNKVVENVSEQYKLMRGKNISNDELWKLLQKVDLNKGEYNLKDVKKLIDEIDADYAAGNVPTVSKDEFTGMMKKMKRSVDWDELGLADKMRYMEEQTGMPYDQIDWLIKNGWINPEDL